MSSKAYLWRIVCTRCVRWLPIQIKQIKHVRTTSTRWEGTEMFKTQVDVNHVKINKRWWKHERIGPDLQVCEKRKRNTIPSMCSRESFDVKPKRLIAYYLAQFESRSWMTFPPIEYDYYRNHCLLCSLIYSTTMAIPRLAQDSWDVFLVDECTREMQAENKTGRNVKS